VSIRLRVFVAVILAVVVSLGAVVPVGAQPTYSLLIKGGHVLDPKNGRDGVMDVAIAGDKIAEVAPSIDAARARRVVDARGLYVVPGLIDLHAHVFYGTEPDAYLSNGLSAVPPDSHSFRSGQTTLVDVGGAGWRNFPQFKAQVIDTSKTRVLSFLNIVGAGMRGGPVEQNLADMDARLTAMRIRQHPGLIVGIKVAHYMGPEWDPVTRAVEAGTEADVPVMIDFGGNDPPLSLDELLNKRLRPGDVLTHAFAHVRGRQPIVDDKGQLEPFVLAARKRGVIFDVGHGGGSFLWRQAAPATKQGFFPDVIGTDLHTGSMNAGMKDILNVMSKMLALGMPLNDVIRANTLRAAEVIKRADLGHLGVGTEADVAVLAIRQGEFGFIDSSGGRMAGKQKLECEVTVRAGQVVWDLNGRAAPAWTEMPTTPQGDGPRRRRVSAQPAPTPRRVIRPERAAADRASSPGVLVGKTLYIAGHLGLPGDGVPRADLTAQTRQAMDGIGGVLKAAGLGYEHLVKCHVYLANMDDYAAMNAAYGSYFRERVPARTTIQAAALPSGAGLEVACIGYADLAGISVVRPPQGTLPAPLGPYSPAVWAGDTLYVSGMGGQDPASKTVGDTMQAQVAQTVANITTTLKAAGLGPSDVVWAQAYGTRVEETRELLPHLEKAIEAPRGAVAVPRLPGPIRAELTFVAAKRSSRGPNFGVAGSHFTARGANAGATVYVDALAAPGGTDVSAESREVFTRLGHMLQRASLGWADVATVSIYLSDIADLPRVDDVMTQLFPADPPARVVIQVHPQGQERVRIGLVAAR
jgi:dihydroorotase